MSFHIQFSNSQSFTTALLIKEAACSKEALQKNYLDPYTQQGGNVDNIIAFSLDYPTAKPTAAAMKLCVNNLFRTLKYLKITTLLVADAAYFKTITGKSATGSRGYIVPSTEGFTCIYTPNYQQAFYDNTIPNLIHEAIQTLRQHEQGTWTEPGSSVLSTEYYPKTDSEVLQALNSLHQHSALSVDIEAFSLRFEQAGIGTIAFAWNDSEGISFTVEYSPLVGGVANGLYGERINQTVRKAMLKDFFDNYKGTLIWSNGYNYDIKVLIYTLYMQTIKDVQGLLNGLQAFYWSREYHDAQVLTYLAVNSTAGNTLNLKHNSAEYMGAYAENVTDIRCIPEDKLLTYNLKDAIATFFVYTKNLKQVTQDNQLPVYQQIMLPSMPVLTQTALTGMPMHMPTINATEASMELVRTHALQILTSMPLLVKFRDWLAQRELEKDFAFRVNKAKNPDKIKIKEIHQFDHVVFNPNSSKQIGMFLHDYLGLTVIDKTPTGNPSTGGDALNTLLNTLMSEYDISEDDL